MTSSATVLGAAPPPPGVVPNFVNPETISDRLILAAAIWPGVALPFLVLRLYTSQFIVRKWHRDDTCIILAFVSSGMS